MRAAVAGGLVVGAALLLALGPRRSARLTTRRRLGDRRAWPPCWTSTVARRAMDRWPTSPVRAGQRMAASLPEALDDVARALRAGTSLRNALLDAAAGGTAPARAALGAIVADADRGRTLREACDRWAASAATSEVRLVAVALGLAADGGPNPARAVEGAAATVRERLSLVADVRAQAAQARLSAAVLAVLPLAFTGWLVLSDDRVRSFLVASPLGWACLAAGAALDGVGAWWMQRITGSIR